MDKISEAISNAGYEIGKDKKIKEIAIKPIKYLKKSLVNFISDPYTF